MRKIRVLSLDGGGMRGIYTATYLECLRQGFEKRRGTIGLDLGKSFDLIVGTSTGAIIACALAAAVPLPKITELYRKHGSSIFPLRLPQNNKLWSIYWDTKDRPKALAAGSRALKNALIACFDGVTLGQIYQTRGIALAIPAVELQHHQSFVFKTPHIAGSMHRDDDYSLVDVCLSSSAAPIFRSLAAVDTRGISSAYRVFADGGLWANNPVLVGLIDAVRMTSPGDRIEIFCMGTCPRPSGDFFKKHELDLGLLEWKFGGKVATLAMDAQEFAYDHMAKMLAPHLDRDCQVMRFPSEQVPAEMLPYLDLDNTTEEAAHALEAQACKDAEMTNSRSNDPNDYEGRLVLDLFTEMRSSKE